MVQKKSLIKSRAAAKKALLASRNASVGTPEAIEISNANAFDVSDANALDISDANALDVSDANALDVSDANALDVSDANALDVSDANAHDVSGCQRAGRLRRRRRRVTRQTRFRSSGEGQGCAMCAALFFCDEVAYQTRRATASTSGPASQAARLRRSPVMCAVPLMPSRKVAAGFATTAVKV